MIPAEGSGGDAGSDTTSFNGPDVHVDIKDLTSYYFQMLDLQMDATGPALMELSPMAEMIRTGLCKAGDSGAGVFPEGAYAARLLASRQSDFRLFMTDVLEGVRNIGSAAAVIGEVYENADSESAAKLTDVGFAFSDPTASPPRGFRPAETWSQYDQRMAAQRGETAMSVIGDDSVARMIQPAAGVTIYLFPDGSSKQVVTSTTSGSSTYQSPTEVTTTTVYAPGAVLVSTTTKESSVVYGGSSVERTTISRGDSRNGSSASTVTTTDPGGRVTVTSETTTRTNGQATTTTSKPVTVDPGQHLGESGVVGPVEQAEEQLDTYGEDWYVKQFGRGY